MPTDEKKPPDAMHFTSLQVENVRAFANPQVLDFVDEDNVVSRWNLILGENGVGKTTLMQALAVMWPIPALKEPNDKTPNVSKPALSDSQDDNDIARYIRRGGPGWAKMKAKLRTEEGIEVTVGVTIKGSTKLEVVQWDDDPFVSRSGGPLVIGYGAARHVGHRNLAVVQERKATESLFSDAIDLFDAEELVETLDYAAAKNANHTDNNYKRRLMAVKAVVASLLPGNLNADDIEIRGPHIAGIDPERSGVHVRTPSGVTPLADLSLGYQTMFALTVDLAWRLFQAFPLSSEPLSESAIVLIDEVDLHLHPSWQRNLRQHLLAHFPKIQFIVTTHSPITAQEALSDEGEGNLAVVRWMDGEAQILNDPIPRGEWSSDQLLVSELFGFGSDRSSQAEEKLYERVALIRKANRTPEEAERLRQLDIFVASLPTASSPNAQSFEDLMLNRAKNYKGDMMP